MSSPPSSTLPATQDNTRGPIERNREKFFLWTRSEFKEPSVQKIHNDDNQDPIQEKELVTEKVIPSKRTIEEPHSIHTTQPVNLEQNNNQLTEDIIESDKDEDEEDRARFRAPLSSFQNRFSWRAPTFASKLPATQGLPKRRQREEDEDDDDRPPPSTFAGLRDWRTPLTFRSDQEQNGDENQSPERPAVGNLNLRLPSNYDLEEPLATLEDTDDSDMEEENEEEMDEFEMQDYLKYRLRTGLNHLDERLGKESLHAAQDDEALHADQGGLTSGGLIEISGTPGSGKTTLLMQMAIKERLNSLIQSAKALHEQKEQSLLGSYPEAGQDEAIRDETSDARQVVIIDTEGSISIQRLVKMAKSLIDELLQNWQEAEWIEKPSHTIMFDLTMSGIHLIRCTSLYDLLATFEVLFPESGNPVRLYSDSKDEEEDATKDKFNQESKQFDEMAQSKQLPNNTSLIVVDTISHFFRTPTTNEKQERLMRQNAFMAARMFANRCHSCGIKLIVSMQMSSSFVDLKGERITMINENSIGFMRPTLRDWMDDETLKDSWHIQLYRANLTGQKRIIKILSRPYSLLNHDLFGEDYWNVELPYIVDQKDGLMHSL